MWERKHEEGRNEGEKRHATPCILIQRPLSYCSHATRLNHSAGVSQCAARDIVRMQQLPLSVNFPRTVARCCLGSLVETCSTACCRRHRTCRQKRPTTALSRSLSWPFPFGRRQSRHHPRSLVTRRPTEDATLSLLLLLHARQSPAPSQPCLLGRQEGAGSATGNAKSCQCSA